MSNLMIASMGTQQNTFAVYSCRILVLQNRQLPRKRLHLPWKSSRVLRIYHLHDMQSLLCLFLVWLARKACHHSHLELPNVLLKSITAKDHAKDSSRIHELLVFQACFAILVIPEQHNGSDTAVSSTAVYQHDEGRRQGLPSCEIMNTGPQGTALLGTLSRITQNLVRFAQFLKTSCRLRVIRVPEAESFVSFTILRAVSAHTALLHRLFGVLQSTHLAGFQVVRFLDLIRGRSCIDSKYIVERSVLDHAVASTVPAAFVSAEDLQRAAGKAGRCCCESMQERRKITGQACVLTAVATHPTQFIGAKHR